MIDGRRSDAGRSVGFIMEQTLGHVTHYLNLRRQEAEAHDLRPRWMPIAFQRGRLPWLITGSLAARKVIEPIFGEVEGLFVHTPSIALLASDYFRRKPAILSTDGTPLNKQAMRDWYGLPRRSRLAERAKRAIYRRVFGTAVGFVVWSEWVKQSLVEDYDYPESDVSVIPPGVDLEQYRPGSRLNPLPRILFVGGDFTRKGGDLLLDVFRDCLRGRAELVLVTSAPIAAQPGVAVHRDISANSSKMRELYAECDIFALPTRADCWPVAGIEALAAGLPVVMTKVGGIPGLVRDGETGFLLAPDDREALTNALERLVTDAERRRAMGRLGREDAEQRFDSRKSARRLFEFVRSRL